MRPALAGGGGGGAHLVAVLGRSAHPVGLQHARSQLPVDVGGVGVGAQDGEHEGACCLARELDAGAAPQVDVVALVVDHDFRQVESELGGAH